MYISGHPLDEFQYELEHFCTGTIKDVQNNPNTPMMIGVLIADVVRKTSMKGDPYAILKAEDQSGEMELSFFGKDYITFAAFFEKNARLRVTGTYSQKFRDSDQWMFKVTSMEFLHNILNAESKFLEIAVGANWVDGTLVGKLSAIVQKHKGGDKPLLISVATSQERSPILLKSSQHKLKLSRELLSELEGLNILSIKIRPDDGRYRKLVTKAAEEEIPEMIEED
jgi:DNA polymerase III subunit alpha